MLIRKWQNWRLYDFFKNDKFPVLHLELWIKNEITSGTDYVFNSRAGGGDTLGITLIQTTTTGYIISNSYNTQYGPDYL